MDRQPSGFPCDETPAFPSHDMASESFGPMDSTVRDQDNSGPTFHSLRPLQDGILFHHLLNDNRDAYVLSILIELDSHVPHALLAEAAQAVIDRHAALRASFRWEQSTTPVQVIHPRATLPVDYVALRKDIPLLEQLRNLMRPDRPQMDLRVAPLVRLTIARQPQANSQPQVTSTYGILQIHHLLCDYQSLRNVVAEIMAQLDGELTSPPPAVPEQVAQTLMSKTRRIKAEEHFRAKLGDLIEPTFPFGLSELKPHPEGLHEHQESLGEPLTQRIRATARRIGASPARLFHAAWALVVARTSGRDDIVFGTILRAVRDRDEYQGQRVGLLVNTLPILLKLKDVSAQTFLDQTHGELRDLLKLTDIPLSVAQRSSGITGAGALFGSSFTYRRATNGADAEWTRSQGARVLQMREAWTDYPIAIYVDELCDVFRITAQTDRRLDSARVAGYLATAAQSLVDALDHAPQTPVLRLEVVPQSERQELLAKFNRTRARLPLEAAVHQLFEKQVAATPDSIALVFGKISLTYAQLNSRANQLARYLRKYPVARGSLVGLCVSRGLDLVVGLIGILKAGYAYVPLDPHYPPDRIRQIVSDAGLALIITQQDLLEQIPTSDDPIVMIDLESHHVGSHQDHNLDLPDNEVQSPAYVIYTSGSTGRPKGVVVEHRGVTNFLAAMQETFHLGSGDSLLATTTIAFDIAALEIYLPLVTGAKVILATREAASDPNALQRLFNDCAITHFQATPATWQMLVNGGWTGRSQMTALCGGEALTTALSEQLLPRVRALWNLYGPTETTIWSCMRQIVSTETQSLQIEPIGLPLNNTQVYILDSDLRPVPMCVTGEIYIGGVGVSRGYLSQPELTCQRFIADPFARDQGARMYATGDLGRRAFTGTIEYAGRNDAQVKIRGFRIELGEIESQLLRHGLVREAAVLAREDILGDKRLVAYVVPAEGQSAPNPEELRLHIKAKLPEYMIPTALVVLEKLPRTPNGKIDRRSLPKPDAAAYQTRQYEAPLTGTEEKVAAIWGALLGIDQIGRQDNFFQLGGHSLLVVQMLERLRQIGLHTEVRTIFETPTLAALVSELGSGTLEEDFAVPKNLIPDHCQTITPEMLPLVALEPEHIEEIVKTVPGGARNVQDIYPLIPLQEGILFHHLLSKQTSSTYIASLLLSVSSLGHMKELVEAIQTVIQRHDIFRTAILWEGLPKPVQVVHRRVSVPVDEITLDPSASAEEQIKRLMDPHGSAVDLQRPPLAWMTAAAKPGSDEWYIRLRFHHLICDNESLRSFVGEVLGVLAETEHDSKYIGSYRDHVARVLSQANTDDVSGFFRNMLSDIEEPTAPFRLLDVYQDGSRVNTAIKALEEPLAERIRSQARRHGIGPAVLFHSAWALVVAHTSSRDDVVFGTVLLGRLKQAWHARHTLGMFINTLPIRISLAKTTAAQLVSATARALTDLLAHVDSSLAVAQGCSGVSASMPLFSAVLNYRHSVEPPAQTLRTLGLRWLAESEAHTNYPLTLSIDDTGRSFLFTAQTHQRVDATHICEYLGTAVSSLVQALESSPHAQALGLSIVPDEELTQTLQHFNATRKDYRSDTWLPDLIDAQVAQTPNSIAVSCGDRKLTYSELNRRAHQLASRLISLGVHADTRVALFLDRSVDLPVAMLATWKAGGAYVPIDVSYPAERIAYILQDCAAAVVLTHKHLKATLPDTPSSVIELDADPDATSPQSADITALHTASPISRNLAYVIYTSGSTGSPKGVMVEHGSLLNLIYWHSDTFNVTPNSRCSGVASVGFDAATWEIWTTLVKGAELVLSSPALTADTDRLIDWWANEKLDFSYLPTPVAELAFDRAVNSQKLHALHIGGDQLRSLPAHRSFVLFNHYGPTETTIIATSAILQKNDTTIHIGRPIANTSVYILNSQGKPVPIGVEGEMFIGGAAVARGYLNRPDLTRERFIPDPFSSKPHARMYKTGDLARWRKDGTIEFLGRNDQQVKIRGFRIELAEIESQLARHELLKDVVVVAREHTPGDRRLVAYVVPMPGSDPDVSELREYLRVRLPGYMVPTAFVRLNELPLTPNGKLERRGLPAPGADDFVGRSYDPPLGELEETLAAIWGELLGISKVGRDDNFFELGGHSLLIVQMLERLRQAGLALGLRHILANPVLSALAAELQYETHGKVQVPPNLIPSDCITLEPWMLPLVELTPDDLRTLSRSVPEGARNVQDVYPLSPLQEGILFHHLLDSQRGDTYILSLVLKVCSGARLDELIAALNKVIVRHDVLRTAFLWEDISQPVQVVYRKAALPVTEIQLSSDSDCLAQIEAWIKPERQRMDIRQAPLLGLHVAADPHSQEWYAFLQLHHLTCDHVSIEIIAAEVVSHLEGMEHALPAPAPYRNHLAQTRAYTESQDSEAFFRGKLGDVTESTSAFGILDVHSDGTGVEEASGSLEPVLGERIRATAREIGVSPATLFHAAWALVVALTSGREDVVFGTVLLGRMQGHAGVQHVVGMFINTLPIRLKLVGVSVRGLVAETQRELMGLLAHDQSSLATAQRCSGIVGTGSIFNTLLNYRHSVPKAGAGWSEASGVELVTFRERTNYPITLSVDDLGERFSVTALTHQRINPETIVRLLSTSIQALVETLGSAPRTPALALTVVPEAESRKVLEIFNATETSFGPCKLAHELFEEQAWRTPGAIAVSIEDQRLTYRELNRYADVLARHLVRAGLGPDRLAGICLSRGLYMIVSVLAVLKAGGAYLPLDPSYPPERVRYMIEDSAPVLVISEKLSLHAPLPLGTKLIDIHSALHDVDEALAIDEPERNLSPQNLVYVIYTSGSTGRPKGTAMPHSAMSNLIEWHRQNLSAEGRNVLQFAALSFDVAFQEIFTTLCSGGRLILLEEEVRRDSRALIELLSAQEVERLFIPPLMLQSLAESAIEFKRESAVQPLLSLRDIITAGEPLRITDPIVQFFGTLPGCRLHNHYGPTETHVVTTLTLSEDPSMWPALPSIGRPIANVQIFVLDARGRPVPVGVTGQIYVGGLAPARGYIHRPALTATRFIADPYGDGPLSRVYDTGDLGRWLPDGSIEYLGRNDDQVKVRGFRIELGEIETLLASHPEVAKAAAVVRDDPDSGKYIAAYFTLRGNRQPTSEELRAHLKTGLPQYMIPRVFVVLDEFPVTPTGKLNRRALPFPITAAPTTAQIEAPDSEVEKELADIWRSLLTTNHIGRNDNLFELGAHSLLVLKAISKINRVFHSTLRVTDVYKNPTIRELADRVGGSGSEDVRIDLAKEATLDDDIRASTELLSQQIEHVLLTGATGFVGRFLLCELLRETTATVSCLVRAPSEREARNRIKHSLLSWDLWRDEFEPRILAVPGDLRRLRLGLNDTDYESLADADSIIHCGASMNHLETYATAKVANVVGMKDLLRLAIHRKIKRVNYVSSLGIFTASTPGTSRAVDEQTPIDGEVHWNSRGYTASKWVAEKVLMAASERGIPCNIFRVGLVWADTSQGRYDELQHIYRHLKSCLLTGYGIQDYRYEMAPTPVDYVARSITYLATQPCSESGIYHVSASHQLPYGVFECCNEVAGMKLKLLPLGDWERKIQQLHQEGRSLPLGPLLEFHEQQRLSRISGISFSCASTHKRLERAGIMTPALDKELLKLSIDDMLRRDPELREIVATRSVRRFPKGIDAG